MRIIPIGKYSIKIYNTSDGSCSSKGRIRVFSNVYSTESTLVNHIIFGRSKVEATEDNIKRAIRYCDRGVK